LFIYFGLRYSITSLLIESYSLFNLFLKKRIGLLLRLLSFSFTSCELFEDGNDIDLGLELRWVDYWLLTSGLEGGGHKLRWWRRRDHWPYVGFVGMDTGQHCTNIFILGWISVCKIIEIYRISLINLDHRCRIAR